jgi:succinoglycan biosynthesis protein ExoO
MAAFNGAPTITIALESILTQTLKNIEIIIVDDASSDNTLHLLGACNDNRLTILRNMVRMGPGPSRDRAISTARGKWIAFIDADDAWSSTRLDELLKAAELTSSHVAFDDLMLCHDSDRGLIPWRTIHGTHGFGGRGSVCRVVEVENYIRSPRLIVKPIVQAELIHRYKIRHSARWFAEDAEFILRFAHTGARFCYLPEPMYFYRITPGSLTAQSNDRTAMRKCLEDCAQWRGWSTSVRRAFRQKTTSLRQTELAYDLADALKARSLIQALRIMVSNPKLMLDLPIRIQHEVDYQWHRIRHAGRRR